MELRCFEAFCECDERKIDFNRRFEWTKRGGEREGKRKWWWKRILIKNIPDEKTINACLNHFVRMLFVVPSFIFFSLSSNMLSGLIMPIFPIFVFFFSREQYFVVQCRTGYFIVIINVINMIVFTRWPPQLAAMRKGEIIVYCAYDGLFNIWYIYWIEVNTQNVCISINY